MQGQRHNREGGHYGDAPAPPPIDGYGQIERHTSHRADDQPPRSKVHWRFVIGIGLVIIVVIGALSAFSQQFRHQVEISVVRQGTPYTQLYFASPTKLPTELKVDKKNIIAFTIENDEGRVYRYTYTVTLEDSQSQAVMTRNTVTVGDGDSATRQIAVTPKDRKSTYLITVSLEGMNQSIHFYADTPASGAHAQSRGHHGAK
jgi:hypothetical protein